MVKRYLRTIKKKINTIYKDRNYIGKDLTQRDYARIVNTLTEYEAIIMINKRKLKKVV